MLVPTNESKAKIKKNEKLWGKIRDLIRSLNRNSDDCDEKYMKIKFNSDEHLPLNKMLEVPCMIIVVRADFHGLIYILMNTINSSTAIHLRLI